MELKNSTQSEIEILKAGLRKRIAESDRRTLDAQAIIDTATADRAKAVEALAELEEKMPAPLEEEL